MFRGELAPNCPISEKGILCGRRHHILLHGVTSKYCNIARVGSKAGPPTIDKIEEEDQQGGVSTLMQVQDIPVRGRVTVRGIVLWDSAANVNLIRRDFAKKLQVEGWACVQHIQVAAGDLKPWKTAAYKVHVVDRKGDEISVLAFTVDEITKAVKFMDVSGVVQLFNPLTEWDLHVSDINPASS